MSRTATAARRKASPGRCATIWMPTTRNDLARQYSYSPSHLIRSFHQAYGASPMQYLKKLRIEHASQLLLHSDATIQSVGEMVGLRIPSYFIRVFKQEIGITPAQYRMFYAEENGGSEAP